MYITGNINDEDIKELLSVIIDDNKFDRKSFLKECGLMPNTKNIKLDHLASICKHKGYTLEIKLPEDRIAITYHLENQELETENSSIDDLPEEFKKDSDEEDDLF
jgi:hypothetical protein